MELAVDCESWPNRALSIWPMKAALDLDVPSNCTCGSRCDPRRASSGLISVLNILIALQRVGALMKRGGGGDRC